MIRTLCICHHSIIYVSYSKICISLERFVQVTFVPAPSRAKGSLTWIADDQTLSKKTGYICDVPRIYMGHGYATQGFYGITYATQLCRDSVKHDPVKQPGFSGK